MTDDKRAQAAKGDGHRVEVTFNNGTYAKLICPESGCEPAHACGECGRSFDDPSIKPCYDCEGAVASDECWVKSWFDNLTAEELLVGKVILAVETQWDGDSVTAHVTGRDGGV